MLQKKVKEAYINNPQSATTRHRVHAALTVVGNEWKRSLKEEREPDINRLSLRAISKGCADAADAYPDWPSILLNPNLSDHAAGQPKQVQWWTVGHPSDDGDDGKFPFPCAFILSSDLITRRNSATTPFI